MGGISRNSTAICICILTLCWWQFDWNDIDRLKYAYFVSQCITPPYPGLFRGANVTIRNSLKCSRLKTRTGGVEVGEKTDWKAGVCWTERTTLHCTCSTSAAKGAIKFTNFSLPFHFSLFARAHSAFCGPRSCTLCANASPESDGTQSFSVIC